jgi:hypothetical protein
MAMKPRKMMRGGAAKKMMGGGAVDMPMGTKKMMGGGAVDMPMGMKKGGAAKKKMMRGAKSKK